MEQTEGLSTALHICWIWNSEDLKELGLCREEVGIDRIHREMYM